MFFKQNTDIGQNFLRDASVVDWMTRRAALTGAENVLEIGPGKGILTKGILHAGCAHLDAIELDTRLGRELAPLLADERLAIHWADAVRFDYTRLEFPPTHAIANLPYHITTPLIWRLLESCAGGGLRYMLLMVQYEAAERLASGAGVRKSNPLGITLAAMAEVSVPRRVSRGAFSPMPRVDSAIVEVRLTGEHTPLPGDKAWRRLLTGSFAQRRKTLANSWGAAFGIPKDTTTEILARHALPATSRPEELPLAAWFALHEDETITALLSAR